MGSLQDRVSSGYSPSITRESFDGPSPKMLGEVNQRETPMMNSHVHRQASSGALLTQARGNLDVNRDLYADSNSSQSFKLRQRAFSHQSRPSLS